MKRLLLLFSLLLFPASLLHAENWPAWRGPLGQGTTSETGFATQWSQEDNLAWKVELPGPGNSTPIVWKDKVFITQASDEGRQRSLICYSLKAGEKLWEQSVRHEAKEVTHKTNPQCASSPVTDGSTVIAWHGSAGLFAYDLEGNLRWKKDLGAFQHVWGTAASPVIFENKVILNGGPGLNTFVSALDVSSGDSIWHEQLPDATSLKIEEFRGSWSTPQIAGSGDKAIMFLSMPQRLYAIHPHNGKQLWTCEGASKLVYTSPIFNDSTVVTMSGYHGPSLAVRRGGEGNVTASHRLWHKTERQANPQRIGSGVIIGGHIYIVNEPGIAWCMELKSGDVVWQQRLGSAGCWSSVCHVDGKLFVVNMAGSTFVIDPSPEACKIVAENKLGEMTRGSLAFSQGRILIRTYKHLYCIAPPE